MSSKESAFPSNSPDIVAHLDLVKHFLRGIPSEYVEDRYHDGVVGILKARERYDQNKGVEFSVFAQNFILGHIIDGNRKDQDQSRLTSKVLKYSSKYLQKNGQKPTVQEIASGLGADISSVQNILNLQNRISFDHDLNLTPDNQSVDNQLLRRDLWNVLNQALSSLDPKESYIIQKHIIEKKKQKELAAEFGLTVPRISQIVSKGLAKLKENQSLREYLCD